MIKIANESEYPTREVTRLVLQTLAYQDITDGVRLVTVRHFSKKTGLGQERTWMGGWYSTSERSILAKIVRPGLIPDRYEPYQRTRGTCPTFALNDWREQLVALIAHEAKHHIQRPGPYVENDADLAAYRAVGYYREDQR